MLTLVSDRESQLKLCKVLILTVFRANEFIVLLLHSCLILKFVVLLVHSTLFKTLAKFSTETFLRTFFISRAVLFSLYSESHRGNNIED